MKKTYLKILILTIFILLILPAVKTQATTVKTYNVSSTITGTLDDKGILKLTGTGAIDSYWYLSETPWKEESKTIKKIVVEEGITEIGFRSFGHLENLEEISLPSTVTKVSTEIITDSNKVKKFTVASGNKNLWIDSSALIYKDAYNNIILEALPPACTVTNYTISNNVTKIQQNAFANCKNLKTVEIPNTINYICAGAFQGSGITSITIPNITVEFIGTGLFENCEQLETVNYSVNVTGQGMVKDNCLRAATFRNCKSLKTVNINTNIKFIDQNCFAGCTSLESISLPEGLQDIYEYAFKNCSNLATVKYSSTIASIAGNAFDGCTKLTKKFPDGFELKSDGYYRAPNIILTATGTYDYDRALEVIAIVNEERAKNNLESLTFDKDLFDAAMLRAAESSFRFEASHKRPSGEDCGTVIKKAMGENIAINTTPEQVMKAWMNSPGHRMNILMADYKSIGVGCYEVDGKYYYVQIFSTQESENSNTTEYSGTKVANTPIEFSRACVADFYCFFDRISESEGIDVGKTEKLGLRIINSDGYILTSIKPGEYSVTFKDSTLFSVENGQITAMKPGETEVTFELAGFKKTYQVKSAQVPTGISLNKKELTLYVGDTAKLNATITPNNANKYTYVYWKSYNTNVVEVDKNGNITAKKAGTTKIRGNTANGKEAYCTVTVKNLLPFPDVKREEWYYNAIEYVYNKGLMSGYTAGDVQGNFGPNDQITRGQIVTILYRMEGQPTVTGTINFSDVKNSGEYYYNPVKWAAAKGIVTGYKEGVNKGKFLPNNPITREEFAIILQRYAKYKGKNVSQTADLTQFGDYKKVSDWAVKELKWAVAVGIITGNKDTVIPTIKPQGNASRAEAATMIMRLKENVMK